MSSSDNLSATTPRLRRMRVRADEIQVGDTYVVARTPDGPVEAPVMAIQRRKTITRGGAHVTWIEVTIEGFPSCDYAPHSKHTVRRSA
jgi:hypothetical protein